MKNVILMFSVFIMFTACNNSNTVSGTYEGTVPCADCDGIKKVVVLNADNTYSMSVEYLGEGKTETYSEDGTYSFDTTSNMITLSPSVSSSEVSKFLVRDGNIVLLDANGQENMGELANQYILNKK